MATNKNSNPVSAPLSLAQKVAQRNALAAAQAMAEGMMNKGMMMGYTLPNEAFIVNHQFSSNGNFMLRLQSVTNPTAGTVQLYAYEGGEAQLKQLWADKEVVYGDIYQDIEELRFIQTNGSNYQLMSAVTIEGLKRQFVASPNPILFGSKKKALTDDQVAMTTALNKGQTAKAAVLAASNQQTQGAGSWFGGVFKNLLN